MGSPIGLLAGQLAGAATAQDRPRPLPPGKLATESVQNTDPMVFGDAFIYSNCLQPAYPSLRGLSPGSIVLFGRFARENGRPSFNLDTCLVVDHARTLAPAPAEADSFGSDLLTDVILGPLHTERVDTDLTVYFGRRRSRVADPFSFFPARIMHGTPPLFARPELRPTRALHGVINPSNMQGIKMTSGLSTSDRDAIWTELVRQITRQGCGLGHDASPPPLLESHEAESAAKHRPMPLGD